MQYPEFFASAMACKGESAASANPSAYDYQLRLACGEGGGKNDSAWLSGGTDCRSQLINIPTGLGKTAAVVLSWLWNRVVQPDGDRRANWPRRLIYCLPMRTLVEQTEKEIAIWLRNTLKAAGDLGLDVQAKKDLEWLAQHSPVVLMGGEELSQEKQEWDIYPEQPCIIIGTQDMLLSRALNRGYGMSRYRWPMHFGLLNNDCLWVMDETQLMGVGVETSAQLDGFRLLNAWKNQARCFTWWMSATLENARLATVDHPTPDGGWPGVTLSDKERANGRPKELFEAPKTVDPCSITLSASTKTAYAKEMAKLVSERHATGTLTLVIVNRVSRTQAIYDALTKGGKPLYAKDRVALIHSRFRPMDRKEHEKLLFGEGDRIVIATQAVEAGVDVSARLLITELAPWAALVQRFGRCNRRAEGAGEVLWIDIELDAKGELLLPYTKEELDVARAAMGELTDASPRALAAVEVVETKPAIRPVIRRRDLIDLFDTTPDICGQDLDISRYIRDSEDNDVQFFWREISDQPNPTITPTREEICRVSVGDARRFFEKQAKPRQIWQWNILEEKWLPAENIRPGGTYLLAADKGGYDENLGWTGKTEHKPERLLENGLAQDAQGGDKLTYEREWVLLSEHSHVVATHMSALCGQLGLDPALAAQLHTAALWHDVGKAHEVFQKALLYGDKQPDDPKALYAKSKNPYRPNAIEAARKGFRHELASALAWLAAHPASTPENNLAAYLIAAHHGKVRLSLRALPEEKGDPDNPSRLFARGIWENDPIPAIPGILSEPVALDLSLMQMGQGKNGPSWLARMVALRDYWGPFKLAYLECLLRAADGQGSKARPTEV